MKYELYDILEINGKEYSIISMIVDGDFEYFLLNEIDSEENLIVDSLKLVVGHSLATSIEDNRLLHVTDEEELKRLNKMLVAAMMDDVKEVE